MRPRLLFIAAAAAVILAGCPLPFEYNGKGSSSHSADPSSPTMTAPVTVSYSEEGGGTGSILDGGAFASGKTTTVTLSTASLNAVIFYTDGGLTLSDLRQAKKIDASSGSFTISRTTTPQSLDIHAVAVGPNMLPSPLMHFSVDVTPYPILTVTRNNASISENGGAATFTITASAPAAGDIPVTLQTGGTYGAGEVGGLPVSGTIYTATLFSGTTSISIPITGNHDANGVNEAVTLSILTDPNNPPSYSVGATASASVAIQDDNVPVLTIVAGPSTITDNGATAVFTVVSSFVPLTNMPVTLQTGGSYKPGDLTATPSLPLQGGTFVLTLPAGQTSVPLSVTAHPDPGEYLDQVLSITVVPTPAYTVGSGPAAVTILDTSPIPVLTLTAGSTNLTDGQSATFTVTANVAPDTNLAVGIASGGYTPGKVIVPSGVTLPTGTTSTTFQVSSPSEVGYLVQNPVISLVPGIGYTVGSPGSQNVTIQDDIVGITYDGIWGFATDTGSGVGTGAAWTLSGNVTLGGGGLTFGGVYGSDDATVPLSAGGVDFDKNHFTLAVKFAMAALGAPRPIIVGGPSYRWYDVDCDQFGNLSVIFNNHSFTLPLGMAIAAGTAYTLVLNLDADALTLTAWLNGARVVLNLPPGFTWNNPGGDEILTATDYSQGRAFLGTWYWVFAVNGLLSYDTVVSLAAGQ